MAAYKHCSCIVFVAFAVAKDGSGGKEGVMNEKCERETKNS
jgi:hypothetical protein